MSPTLKRIAELNEDDLKVLSNKGISTDQHFWTKLSGDETLLDGIAPDNLQRIVEVMTRHSVAIGERLTRNWFADHFLDVLFVAVLSLVTVALIRKPWAPPPRPSWPAVRVNSDGGIQPFHVITERDVVVDTSDRTTRPVSINSVVGHYPSTYLPKQSEIDPEKLSAGTIAASELAPLRLLYVSFATDAGLLSLVPPMKMSLAASSSVQPPTGVVLEDVYLLHTQAQSDRIAAVIATTPGNVERLAPFLGAGRLIPVVVSR